MPATLAATGTWTTLHTSTSTISPTGANVPTTERIDGRDLQTVPSEVIQVVDLFASAYGLRWWVALTMLKHWFNSVTDQATLNVPTSLTPTP